MHENSSQYVRAARYTYYTAGFNKSRAEMFLLHEEQVLQLVQHFILIPFLWMRKADFFLCKNISTGLTLSQSVLCCFLGNAAYATLLQERRNGSGDA